MWWGKDRIDDPGWESPFVEEKKMNVYPQDPICGYCHEKIAAHPCPGKVGSLKNDLTAALLQIDEARRFEKHLESQISERDKIITDLRMDVSVKIGENVAQSEELNEQVRLNGESLRLAHNVHVAYCELACKHPDPRDMRGRTEHTKFCTEVSDYILREPEKRNDLGLDFATYEAAKKEQAEGKRIKLDDVISGLQGCQVCGSKLVMIRGKIPKTPDREVCACCAVEKLEEIEFQKQMREQGPAQAL